jgi:hypothetical protein
MEAASESSKPVKVIGAGWGRTATFSLKTALEILGMKTYHMVSDLQMATWYQLI